MNIELHFLLLKYGQRESYVQNTTGLKLGLLTNTFYHYSSLFTLSVCSLVLSFSTSLRSIVHGDLLNKEKLSSNLSKTNTSKGT